MEGKLYINIDGKQIECNPTTLETEKHSTLLEYYMRRGKKYFFRNQDMTMSFEADNVPELLNEHNVVLEYGKSYRFNYTLS